MTSTVIISAFLIGLTGSFHCVGMCGPLAMALPMRTDGSRITSILLYFLGKTFTYSLLGGLFGLFGSRLIIAGFQQSLSIFLGIALLTITLMMVLKKSLFHQSVITDWISLRLSPFFIKLLQSTSRLSAIGFGMLNGLLPCGLVYLGVFGAIATGSAFRGMLFMACFGIGTIPLMLSFLLMAKQLSFSFRKTMQAATPIVMSLMAVLLIVRGLGLSIPYLSPALMGGLFADKASSIIVCHP